MKRFLAVAILLFSARAMAQIEAERDPRAGWREIADPERRIGRLFLREGLRRLLDAMNGQDPELGDAHESLVYDQALLRFDRARRSLPDDPELAYYTAVALTNYQRPGEDGGVERRVDEAIDAWHRLRAIDPSFAAAQTAFHLGALHMQRQEFALARAEYEAALRAVVPPPVELFDYSWLRPAPSEEMIERLWASPPATLIHGNLAEAAMLIGDLDTAIAHYRATVNDAGADPLARVLALWGLALALDRDGAHEEAVRAAGDAIAQDPIRGVPGLEHLVQRHGVLAALHYPTVFFEPRCEIHAYEALGHEALARGEGGDRAELRRAQRSWRLFLAEGGSTTRYAPIARAHVDRLEREFGAWSRR